MHVTVTTTQGAPDMPNGIARLAGEEMLPWLREIDGFEGLLMLADGEGRTLVVSFWESREVAERHAAARAEFRDRITSTVDVRVDDVSDFELVFGAWPSAGSD